MKFELIIYGASICRKIRRNKGGNFFKANCDDNTTIDKLDEISRPLVNGSGEEQAHSV